MKRYTTRNSVYEVEGLAIRQVSTRPGGAPTLPLGEWISFDAVETVRLWFAEPERLVGVNLSGPSFTSSPIVSVVDVVQGEVVSVVDEVPDPDPEPCQYVVDKGDSVTPPAYCDEDAVEGEDFCNEHLKGME